MKKVVLAFFVIFCSIAAYQLINQYLFGWQYVFAPPNAFSGDSIVNPYRFIDPKQVQVANFHAHAKNGFLNGKGSPRDVHDRYDSIGLDIKLTSQYQYIDTQGKHLKSFIPVYEHGYNFGKTHQLIIGAKQVLKKDYMFAQTLHNKQEILQRLSQDTSNIVVLNHPGLSSGYKVHDLKYLHYYNHIELLSPYANSKSHWDTALSAGKPIYILGNDDSHDIFNNNELGRFVNLVYTSEHDQKGVMHALKQGQHAVAWLPQKTGETLLQKKNKIESIKNAFGGITITDEKLTASFTISADSIFVYGQHGKRLFCSTQTPNAVFDLPPQFNYLRVEAKFADGTMLLFNPVYKYNKNISFDRELVAAAYVVRDEESPLQNTVAVLSVIFVVGFFGSKKNRIPKMFSRNEKAKNNLQES